MRVENPSGHTAARARRHAHTQTRAKKTQTDRQTEHTQADNMRKNPSKSTNMKQSAEADRYEGASAADAQSRDGRPQTRCTGTDAQNGRTKAENHSPVQRVHARHTHLWFFAQHRQNFLVFELSVPLRGSTTGGPDR